MVQTLIFGIFVGMLGWYVPCTNRDTNKKALI
jgi:hypothetical protein